jgi:hypothetical protein
MMEQTQSLKATAELVRRIQLQRLDSVLGELESLNLRGVEQAPAHISERLRGVGVGHPTGASVTELIDLVFRAQERYLIPGPGRAPRRRSAA